MVNVCKCLFFMIGAPNECCAVNAASLRDLPEMEDEMREICRAREAWQLIQTGVPQSNVFQCLLIGHGNLNSIIRRLSVNDSNNVDIPYPMARVKQERNPVGNRLQVEINKLDQARTAAEIARLENEAAGLWEKVRQTRNGMGVGLVALMMVMVVMVVMMVKRMMRLSENEAWPLKIHCPFCRKSREQGMKQSLKRRQVAQSSPISRLMIPNFFETVYLVTGAHSAIFCLVLESTNGRSWEQLISSFIEARHFMMIRRRRSEKSGPLGAHGWDDGGFFWGCRSCHDLRVTHGSSSLP